MNLNKRCIVFGLLALVSVGVIFGISLKTNEEIHTFDSIPMLEAYYNEDINDNLEAFWDSCSISLITIGSGKPLYSWFGHAALLVEAPGNPSYVFDYGTFSFDADNFYKNFIMGRLWFCCSISYATAEFEYLENTGRSATCLKLNLSAQQKKAIISFLNVNSERENRTYLYHHYNDNCATRLRDIINYATHGDFEAWAKAQEGLSFRKRASGALSRNKAVQWFLEFLQSGQIDKKATLWDEMFLPSTLEKAVLEYGLETGLVSADGYEVILENSSNNAKNHSDEPSSNFFFSLILGVCLAGISFVLLYFGKRKAYCAYSFVVDLILGIMGSVLMFMMFFTNHNVTWYNENLLFVNPLLFVMAIKSLRIKDLGGSRARNLKMWYKVFLGLIALLVVLKVCIPSVFMQQNWNVIFTILPFYVVNAF